MTALDQAALLTGYLRSAHKIAKRLSVSVDRVVPLFPLNADRIAKLSDEEAERLDAFLHRFASLAAAIEDHVGRALLLAEEEGLAEASRKDQRLLLEKLGALKPSLGFDAIAKLRNRLVQSYPDDPDRQAEVLNQAYARSADLLSGLDGLLDYAVQKFGVDLESPRMGEPPVTARSTFDRVRLIDAFTLLGEDLARHGNFVELAVYGGSAIMLQFSWRLATEDVDAVVRQGYDERVLKPSVAAVATRMGLSPDWLNDAVGMFTPLDEPDALFDLAGSYPSGDRPGLRVLMATPHYLLAMKLKALSSLDRGDRDVDDARALAADLGIRDLDALRTLYVSIHGEEPPHELLRQFPAVFGKP